MVCKACNDQMFCSDCVADHSFYGPLKDHKMITITQAANEPRMSAKRENYNREINQITETKNHMQAKLSKLAEAEAKIVASVNNDIKELTLSLDTITSSVLEKVKQEIEQIRKPLLMKAQEIEGILQGIDADLQVRQTLLSYSDAALWKRQAELKKVTESISQRIADSKKVQMSNLPHCSMDFEALDMKTVPRNGILNVKFNRSEKKKSSPFDDSMLQIIHICFESTMLFAVIFLLGVLSTALFGTPFSLVISCIAVASSYYEYTNTRRVKQLLLAPFLAYRKYKHLNFLP